MKQKSNRRSFLKKLGLGGVAATAVPSVLAEASTPQATPLMGETRKFNTKQTGRIYNGSYEGEYLKRIAFPIGGIGAGMFCLEGTGAISHMSVRNKPEIFHEPGIFAALSVKGLPNGTKII